MRISKVLTCLLGLMRLALLSAVCAYNGEFNVARSAVHPGGSCCS